MSAEWKRATWTYDAIGLGHTNTNIMTAFTTFLTSVGYERVGWDTTLDRFFVRSDRRTILLTNDAVGTAGNVAISGTAPNITAVGMSGGTVSVAATGTLAFNVDDIVDGNTVILNDGVNPALTFEFEAGAAAARGNIAFLAQPVAGNTITINDGTHAAKIFEFTTNTGGTHVVVTIGGSLSVTVANLITAINALGAGTLNVTASNGPDGSIAIVNNTTGTSGNVAMSTNAGTNIFVRGMVGGGGSVGVGGGNISVTRGSTVEATIVNLVAAINAANINITARWSSRWAYNGDGPWQHCGIEVLNDTGNTRIVLRCFVENASYVGSKGATNSTHQIVIAYQNTAPNNFTFVGGEYGFFGECGRDGLPVNLAHWIIPTWESIPDFNSTDDDRKFWTSMGVCLDLFGNCKFTVNRNVRFVDNQGANKNYSCDLQPWAVRGSTSWNTATIAVDQPVGVGSRDNFFSDKSMVSGSGTAGNNTGPKYTFGMMNTPRDSRYRLSPMMADQLVAQWTGCMATSALSSNNVANDNQMRITDVRRTRLVPKFSVIDSSLIPFVLLTDQATGTIYRVTQMQDGGRLTNLGVEWPDSGHVVSIPTNG